MNISKHILPTILILITFTNTLCQERNWCKLIPLESDRKDVEIILGKPLSYFDSYGVYRTEFGKFSVWYSTGICKDDFEGRQYNVPAKKMTGLKVTLNKFEPLKNYISNMKDFKKEKPNDNFGRYFYTSLDESLILEVIQLENGNEMVSSISLEPKKEDNKLLCKEKSNEIKKERLVNHNFF